MNIKSLFLLLNVIAVIIFSNCTKRPETLTEDYDKDKMELAIEQANNSFGDFLASFQNPQIGDSAFFLKVRIEDENGIEHFWLGNLTLDAEPFMGIIENDPGVVKNVVVGQTYKFYKKDISDWMYFSNGVMQGNYTLKVLLESMPKEKADDIKKSIGWQ